MTGIWDALRRAAVRAPDSVALIGERGGPVTYGRLAADVDALARRLLALDVRPGDPVALAAGNTYRWIVAYFAIARTGAVAVLLNTRWSAAEFGHALALTGARFVLFEPTVRTRDIAGLLATVPGPTLLPLTGETGLDGLEPAADAEPALLRAELDRRTGLVRPGDVAEMMFTSGSTGFPKAALLRHGGILANAARCTGRLRLGPGDRWCSAVPFFHIGGSHWGLLNCVLTGATLVHLEAFDPHRVLWSIERHRCTVHFAVATMIHDELRQDVESFDLASLRVCAAGADPALRHEVRRRYRVPTVLSMWGLTEAHGNVSLTGPADTVADQDTTFGRAHPGVEVRSADPDTGRWLGPGVEGELLVRGDCVFDGYHRDPEATARSVDERGWLHTGDTGSVLAGGQVVYTGRLGEKIRVGGENVSVTEVEAVLLGHPAVEQCYAVGVPDPRLEEVPIAFVRVRPGTAPDVAELLEHCRGRLADFKRPRRIVLVDDFPTGAAGRVSKSRLRERGALLWPGTVTAVAAEAGR